MVSRVTLLLRQHVHISPTVNKASPTYLLQYTHAHLIQCSELCLFVCVGAYWEEDVGSVVLVAKIKLYNRMDYSGYVFDRPSNSVVTLINSNGTVLDTNVIGNTATVAVFEFQFP